MKVLKFDSDSNTLVSAPKTVTEPVKNTAIIATAKTDQESPFLAGVLIKRARNFAIWQGTDGRTFIGHPIVD